MVQYLCIGSKTMPPRLVDTDDRIRVPANLRVDYKVGVMEVLAVDLHCPHRGCRVTFPPLVRRILVKGDGT